MPRVAVTKTLSADPDDVWNRVISVTEFPARMASVRAIEELSVESRADGTVVAVVGWEVDLDGAVLRWVEQEIRDPSTRTVTFSQISGDLERFDGTWRIRSRERGGTVSELEIEFDIGFAMLREVLDPYAVEMIRDNSSAMLQALDDQKARGQDVPERIEQR